MTDPAISGLLLWIYITVLLLVFGVLDLLARALERLFERREGRRSGESHGLYRPSSSARWGQRSRAD